MVVVIRRTVQDDGGYLSVSDPGRQIFEDSSDIFADRLLSPARPQ